ncbi:MAG: hypothetical protein AB1384_08180 [Actinomycetota bacterium]
MAFNLEEVQPKPNPWFEENIAYEGEGLAEFSNPAGAAEGLVRIVYNKNGECAAVMEVERIEAEKELKLGLVELWSGEVPRREGDKWEISIGAGQNTCKGLVVKTADGLFKTEGKVVCGYKFNWSKDKGNKDILSFSFIRAQFDVEDKRKTKYWVMPLVNHISDYPQKLADLDRHPLRLYTTPVIPEGLLGNDNLLAQITANQQDRIIVFQFHGKPAFIESLPEYTERKEKLISGETRSEITALMIGEAPLASSSFDDLQGWFPFDYLDLLSLASGQEVGSPWIELRDDNGGLVHRIHTRLGSFSFRKGTPIFDEVIHRETGNLLTCSVPSDEFGESYLRSAIKHIIKSDLHGNSIEDSMTHICRGFEAVCAHYGIKIQDLCNYLEDSQKGLLDGLLSSVTKEINEMAVTASREGKHKQASALRIISSRIQNAKNKDRNFGLAVIDLLEKFDCHDAKLVDGFYCSNPRKDGRSWADTLSYYRGAVLHEGYFNIRDGRHEFYDIVIYINHMRDILIRIVLRILGFSGTYQPVVSKMTEKKAIDWVGPDTSATELGYGN